MFKLAIEDSVEFQVKLTIRSGRVDKSFPVTFFCDRVPTNDEITARMDACDNKYKEFLTGLVTGWKDQRLVLDQNDKPVDFSAEALDVMLSAAGVARQVFEVYVREVSAKEKN